MLLNRPFNNGYTKTYIFFFDFYKTFLQVSKHLFIGETKITYTYSQSISAEAFSASSSPYDVKV